MIATLLGAYGTKPLPARHLTSCFVALADSDFCDILIDCGEGTQVAMGESSCSFSSLGTILITHLHGDHVFGLPGLLTSMSNLDRTEPLVIVGPVGTTKMIQSVRGMVGALKFRVHCQELGESVHHFRTQMCEVTAFKVSHSVPCYGYVLETREISACNPDKATGFKVPTDLWSLLRSGYNIKSNGVEVNRSLVFDGQEVKKKLVYCTDTRPCESIGRNCADADLAILEGMYAFESDRELAIANAHMMMGEAAEIAKKAGVKNLWLTHLTAKVVATDPATIAVPSEIYPGAVIGHGGLKMVL